MQQILLEKHTKMWKTCPELLTVFKNLIKWASNSEQQQNMVKTNMV